MRMDISTSELEHISIQVRKLCKQVAGFIQFEAQRFSQEDIERKGFNDLVSYVDKSAEEQLVAELEEILPEAGFIAEEGSGEPNAEGLNWIIDPLDGTTNFVHGIPFFAISVALAFKGDVFFGEVFDVMHNHSYQAIKGKGATMNEKPIRVRENKSIKTALIATGFPYELGEHAEKHLKTIQHLLINSHGIRRIGAAALDLAYVASGKFDGYYEFNLKPWDVAAGSLLVKEAGGMVTDFSGGENFVFGREIIAGGPIFPEFFPMVLNKLRS
jgi:myo-inositol-1(or 4)-monophosphatase